jgi:hypothetical protein
MGTVLENRSRCPHNGSTLSETRTVSWEALSGASTGLPCPSNRIKLFIKCHPTSSYPKADSFQSRAVRPIARGPGCGSLAHRIETDCHGHILMSPLHAVVRRCKASKDRDSILPVSAGTLEFFHSRPPRARQSSELCPKFPPHFDA